MVLPEINVELTSATEKQCFKTHYLVDGQIMNASNENGKRMENKLMLSHESGFTYENVHEKYSHHAHFLHTAIPFHALPKTLSALT